MSVLLEKLALGDHTEKEFVEICPLCDGKESELLFWNCDRLYHLPGKFGTYRCADCGLVRISPRPTVNSIGAYYPEDYGAYVVPQFSARTARGSEGFRGALRRSVLSRLGYHKDDVGKFLKVVSPILSRLFMDRATYGYRDLFPSFVEGGAALEVGCGSGTFLGYLKLHGWNVAGIDLSPHAAKRAKELFDIDVFVGQLEDSPFPPESFDYIHMSHVVEHFFDPLRSIRRVFELLRPGGVVYVEVPNADSIGAALSGQFWYGWDAPRHLFMFTPNTLKMMLEKAGFSFLKMRMKLWNHYDWTFTYKREDCTGEFLRGRPLIAEADIQTIERQKLDAERQFKANPEKGDFIYFWAVKPK